MHAALEELQSKAPEFVNLSQLSLALRGLETGNGGCTRIAILAFNSLTNNAAKLVQLLLANPLKEEGNCENDIKIDTIDTASTSGALLLKYGDPNSEAVLSSGRNQLYGEIALPSPILHRHNLEILISTLSSDNALSLDETRSGSMDTPSDAILVPNLEAGRDGRVTMVRHPVHKAVVIGKGLEDCIKFGTFVAGEYITEEKKGMISFAVDLPGLTEQQRKLDSTVYGVTAVDMEAADKVVERLRAGPVDASGTEHQWLHSGIPILRQWLLRGVPASDTMGNPPLRPALRNLIGHILSTTTSALNAAALSSPATTPSEAHLEHITTLEKALSSWSRIAHTELRDQLDEAFAGHNWAKITWWKLIWRVDDVTMVAEEVLERRWLLSAEKSGLWLMGRLEQAQLLPDTSTVGRPAVSTQNDEAQEVTSTVEAGVPTQNMIERPDLTSPSMSSISRARITLEENSIPPLQATAQRLLLETLSTTSLTSSLAALLWLSSTFSPFEAGGIAAFGLVWALRRLQTRWERKREQWEGETREEGRICLRDVELGIRTSLEQARGRKVPESDGWAQRRDAREAIGRVREELEKLR